jgi:predicted PurR-regulated permease PerM
VVFSRFPEWRILAILGIIALSWHLLSVFGGVLAGLADIFLLLFLSWILAFILEPVVLSLGKYRFSRPAAAAVIYLFLAAGAVVLVAVVLPAVIAQLSQLAVVLPAYFPSDSFLAGRLEGFLANTLNNSLFYLSGAAAAFTNLFLVFILSFYLLLSKTQVSRLVLDLIPDAYEKDYLFLEKTINTTFASFLRVQVALGLILGAAAGLTLAILQVNFALTTAIFAGILAMVPVLGPFLFVLPIALAALTVSAQKMLIAVAVAVLAAQLVYNLLAPKLLGTALKIHPIVVLLAFLVGYKIAGGWGAIFAVPVVSAVAIVGKELLKYWKKEAGR